MCLDGLVASPSFSKITIHTSPLCVPHPRATTPANGRNAKQIGPARKLANEFGQFATSPRPLANLFARDQNRKGQAAPGRRRRPSACPLLDEQRHAKESSLTRHPRPVVLHGRAHAHGKLLACSALSPACIDLPHALIPCRLPCRLVSHVNFDSAQLARCFLKALNELISVADGQLHFQSLIVMSSSPRMSHHVAVRRALIALFAVCRCAPLAVCQSCVARCASIAVCSYRRARSS